MVLFLWSVCHLTLLPDPILFLLPSCRQNLQQALCKIYVCRFSHLDHTPIINTHVASPKDERVNISNISPTDPSVEESAMRNKRKKLKSTNDRFCWRCHKESVDVYCAACPRSWHRKCIGGTPPSPQKWICGECATILTAENAETRSTAMAQLSVDQLCMLLKNVVERLREYPGVCIYFSFCIVLL